MTNEELSSHLRDLAFAQEPYWARMLDEAADRLVTMESAERSTRGFTPLEGSQAIGSADQTPCPRKLKHVPATGDPRPPLAAEGQASGSESHPEPFDITLHLARQAEFSHRTFGPGVRTAGVVDHIRKELREIEAKPHDLSEWIDVVILGLDGAWRAGYPPEAIVAALVAKQAKNEARNWPDWRTADPNKAIEHRRDERQADPARPESADPAQGSGSANELSSSERTRLITERDEALTEITLLQDCIRKWGHLVASAESSLTAMTQEREEALKELDLATDAVNALNNRRVALESKITALRQENERLLRELGKPANTTDTATAGTDEKGLEQ